MTAVFLSASLPIVGRDDYHETSNPFLIQCEVRELVIAIIRERRLVWGGHPSITPMIWTVCQDLGVEYADRVVLYQSCFFEDRFPEETANFNNVEFTPAVPDNREESLALMRQIMLSRADLTAAVFVGGMEGIFDEYEMFRRLHPDAPVLPVAGPGGAARVLAERASEAPDAELWSLDFAKLFRSRLLSQSARKRDADMRYL